MLKPNLSLSTLEGERSPNPRKRIFKDSYAGEHRCGVSAISMPSTDVLVLLTLQQ